MDQHGEKEAENNTQDSTAQRKEAAAAGEEEDTSEASVDQRAVLLSKEVGSGEACSSPALLAHPCSLLQLLLSACAGCLGLHGDCGSDDPKPAADAAPDPAAAPANDSSQGGESGDKANYLYMQGEVVTLLRATVRRPPPPGRPREGSGGNGGAHN